MRNPTRHAALALVTILLAGAAGAQAPDQPRAGPPPPAAAPASPANPPAAATRPTEAELNASFDALSAIEARRLLRERAYAEEALRHLERVAPYASQPPLTGSIRHLRLIAYVTLARSADAWPLVDQVIETRPAEPRDYLAAWYAATALRDNRRAVALLDTASRGVPGVRWAALRELLDRDTVSRLLRRLYEPDLEAERVRLAGALFRIGWPGSDHAEFGDTLRTILVEDRLKAGDTAGARDYAGGITVLEPTLRLVGGRRFDAALPDGTDRAALVRAAIARQDRETGERVAAAPADMERLVGRSQYLRSVGRDADALAVMRPHLADVPATAARGEYGVWLLNEAAFAYATLGRHEEALALLDRVARLPVAENPDLVNIRINHLELLWEAGRNEEVLRRAGLLESEADRFSSDYGRMWIASARVCALASLGRGAEAAPHMERLRALRAVNVAALSRAWLCLGDDAAAGALMAERLGGANPDAEILLLQDYQIGAARGPNAALLDRLTALRDRPEVRAAFDRVGRRLTLPLARTYYGDF